MQAMIQRFAETGCATDQVVRAGRQLAAVLDHVPGFVSCVILRPQDGGLTLLSLFDDQASLQQAEGLAGACLADHLPALGGPAELTTGEVVFQRGL